MVKGTHEHINAVLDAYYYIFMMVNLESKTDLKLDEMVGSSIVLLPMELAFVVFDVFEKF